VFDLTDDKPYVSGRRLIPDNTICIAEVHPRCPNPHAGQWLTKARSGTTEYLTIDLKIVAPASYRGVVLRERINLTGSEDAVRVGRSILRSMLESIAAMRGTGPALKFNNIGEIVSAITSQPVALRVWVEERSSGEDKTLTNRVVFVSPAVEPDSFEIAKKLVGENMIQSAQPQVASTHVNVAQAVPPFGPAAPAQPQPQPAVPGWGNVRRTWGS
jgi:hypothetical protein